MLTELQIEQNKQEFLSLLRSVNREGMDKLIGWLTDPDPKVCDFFIAPSSSKFHGNFKGGLCEHSLNVYKALLRLRDDYEALMTLKGKTFTKITDEACIISALLHDICKIQFYEEADRYYKDDRGHWVTYTGYVVNDRFPIGHGEKSCILAQRFIALSGQELLAIRWHMGYEKSGVAIDTQERQALTEAWNKVPLAYLLHQADSMAAFLLEDMVDPKIKN